MVMFELYLLNWLIDFHSFSWDDVSFKYSVVNSQSVGLTQFSSTQASLPGAGWFQPDGHILQSSLALFSCGWKYPCGQFWPVVKIVFFILLIFQS